MISRDQSRVHLQSLVSFLLCCVSTVGQVSWPPSGEQAGRSLHSVFKPAKLAEMEAAVTNAIADNKLPGGVLWLERRGDAYHRAFGNRAVDPEREPMTEDTIFDLASLTKVVATTPALML